MRNLLIASILIIGLTVFSNAGFAEENDWEQEFVQALQKGKTQTTGQDAGLGYTPAGSTVLENAIKKAMGSNAPPCAVIKIAVDLEYNPYSVIKKIFSHGSDIDLNQLCMCANENDINKQIVAKAAADARISSALCTPIFSSNEIAQVQCLKEIGLGYTPIARTPGRIKPIPKRRPFSVSSPG